jgi:hypothetical protein
VELDGQGDSQAELGNEVKYYNKIFYNFGKSSETD